MNLQFFVLKISSTVFTLLLILLLSGCQTWRNYSDNKFLEEFATSENITHINSDCSILDLSGNSIRKYVGANCIFETNGHTISQANYEITEYDELNRIVWKNPIPTHHQIYKSPYTQQILTIGHDVRPWKLYNKMRFDTLLVLNESGQVVNKFSFYDYLKDKNNLAAAVEPLNQSWHFDKSDSVETEFTHINSFVELVNEENQITGYAALCFLQMRIYILNKNLTQVLETINLDRRKAHALQQIAPNKLMLYVNHHMRSGRRTASVDTYEILNKKFNTIYKNNTDSFSSEACGSVQNFNSNKLFLYYSLCFVPNADYSQGSSIEYVDVQNSKKYFLRVPASAIGHRGELFNASSYLKKNKGL